MACSLPFQSGDDVATKHWSGHDPYGLFCANLHKIIPNVCRYCDLRVTRSPAKKKAPVRAGASQLGAVYRLLDHPLHNANVLPRS